MDKGRIEQFLVDLDDDELVLVEQLILRRLAQRRVPGWLNG